MEINMCDVMLHIDEELNKKEQSNLIEQMHEQKGVIALGYHDNRPHLMIVGYNQDQTCAKELLHAVNDFGLHAELVGL